ncbi:MAG TPA: hypothetical protein VED46_19325 [Alphaproteobacteria bacterium]|nr:hypothetical protein [Alphaproteobacteria bacterium]
MRRAAYLLAIGFILFWTAYCLFDLAYVALAYWSIAPGLALLPFFTNPVVEPGFWADYLQQLTASWGSVLTGAGVIALLVRPTETRGTSLQAGRRIETYPIIPEAERTEPSLLFIEEPLPPRSIAPQREPSREPSLRSIEKADLDAGASLEKTYPPARRKEVQSLEPAEGEEQAPRHPMRRASIVRALRGRSLAASQARHDEPGDAAGAAETPRLFSGGAGEEFDFFEVAYEDGTTSVERLRRSEYGGDDTAGIEQVRRRLAERAAAERRKLKPIAAIKPVSYFGFPSR